MKSEGTKCTSNPYIYGASKMKNVSCSCIQRIDLTCPASFSFNDTAFESSKNKCGTMNFGNIPIET